ncbi:hypothetical protein GPECTOR_12g353 [Gonium pectorale]|uniref:Hint domain-containing protein n=1 Tax=Gonium pectorale TaxID=33097 RepID=A0A150GNM0_GONPE|nr:hypothetical protein GPECTOR_12g353 [Gonium pectorale]|eukprot:KXZ51391.1 hypothetical protein GPECTOR_12g353 [Gonium pectorale]
MLAEYNSLEEQQAANLTSPVTGRRRLIGADETQILFYANAPLYIALDTCKLLDAGVHELLMKTVVDMNIGEADGLISINIIENSGCGKKDAKEITFYFKTDYGADFYVFCTVVNETCTVYYDNSTMPDEYQSFYRRRLLTAADFHDRCLVHAEPLMLENGGEQHCCQQCRDGYVLEGCECHVPHGMHCFPADATVRVLGRADAVRMDELQYGDLVRCVDRSTGAVSYKAVYLFGHREAAGALRYVHIGTASGRTLAATPGHFVPVCVEGCTAEQLAQGAAVMRNRRAGDVRVGDVVLTADPSPAFEAVESVAVLTSHGAFNPYVRGADLIVDGVVASPHSDWILDSVAPAWMVPYLPYIYEALLAPVYGLYCIVGPATAEWLAHGLALAESGANPASGHAGYWAVLAGMAAPLGLTALLLGRNTEALLKRRA